MRPFGGAMPHSVTTHLLLLPMELIEKLAATVPPPKVPGSPMFTDNKVTIAKCIRPASKNHSKKFEKCTAKMPLLKNKGTCDTVRRPMAGNF
jgi:hypothetical protein